MLEHGKRDGSIGGERLGAHGSPQVYGANRVCADQSCSAHLSIYNSAPFCALHDTTAMTARPLRGVPRRRRRPKDAGTPSARSTTPAARTSSGHGTARATAGSGGRSRARAAAG